MKLVVKDLAVNRAGQEVVSGISFELASGESLVVTGENGSGKSTTLRSLAGLLPLAKGQISLFDENGKQFENPVREYCHFLGHENGMKPTLTVRENLDFWQQFMGEELLPVEEALEEVGLTHAIDNPYYYLSAGQKRRVAIARLLVSDRPIWILDEPTVSLDTASVEALAGVVSKHVADGGMVIAATHIPLGIDFTTTIQLNPGGN